MNSKVKAVILLILIGGLGILTFYFVSNYYKPYNSQIISKEDKFTTLDFKTNTSTNGCKIKFKDFKGIRTINEISIPENSKVSINCNFELDKGNVEWVLSDSNFNIIDGINDSTSSKTYNIKNSGNYLLRLISKKASGTGEISIKSDNNIKIHEVSLFD